MYIIRNRNLAGAISFLLKEDFKQLDDKFNKGKVYCFKESEKLHKVLEELTLLRDNLNN